MSQAMIVTTLSAGAGARRRLLSALARGEPVVGVFFFSDGVEAAASRDEAHAWQALARRHRVPLILSPDCAARRGIPEGKAVAAGFELDGEQRLAAIAAEADDISVAGRS